MSTRTLAIVSAAELKRHQTAESCYVTCGGKVYDVAPFLEDHPGGGDFILDHAGQDVQMIMGDVLSHSHSEAAYEILEEHVVGYIAPDAEDSPGLSRPGRDREGRGNPKPGLKGGSIDDVQAAAGLSSEDQLSVETNPVDDYRSHKFLDLNRPLLMQVWNGGFSKDFYLAQVHRPRHYKSGESAPLFGNFLEPLSKTPWWIIPTIWLPAVSYGTILAREGMSSWLPLVAWWLFGLAIWTLVEYGMHRGLFHIDGFLPDNRVAITAHFLLHGIHHYLPMDRLRLVMPPALFIILALPFWKLVHTLFFWNWSVATAVFSGGVFGYICYDITHYALHHRTLPAYYRELKKYHIQHHYADFQNGFGVTSRFWDRVFGTELAPPAPLQAQ